jgi:hypothetical protein
MKRLSIELMPYRDNSFQNSLYSFDIKQGLGKVIEKLEDEFPLKIKLSRLRKWNSAGYMGFNTIFYESVINFRRPKPGKEEETIDCFLKQAGSLGFSLANFETNSSNLTKTLKEFLSGDKEKSYFLGYMMAFATGLIEDFFMRDLKKKSRKKDNQIVIGFTGKIKFLDNLMPANLGGFTHQDSLWTKNAYAIIGITMEDYSRVILHELGHILGAQHSDNDVMSAERPSDDFNDKNRTAINRLIKKTLS